MLHYRQENHVSLPNEFSAPRLCHKIYAFSGSAREYDFLRVRSADIFCDPPARFFVSLRRPRAQLVQATMHIGVLMLVITAKRVDHRSRLLRCCGVIKIDQRMAVRPLAQDREIIANRTPIYSAT